jgi:hypothetical protein
VLQLRLSYAQLKATLRYFTISSLYTTQISCFTL